MALRSLIMLTALWWLLTGGAAESWAVGAPAIAAALAVRRRLGPFPAVRISPAGILRFIAFFLKDSVAGGVDVVRRAFHPRVPLTPGLVDHPLSLTVPAARILAAGTVSLLPGTLSADLDQERVKVHALDLELPVARQLAELEDRVAGIFPSAAAGAAPAGPSSHE